MGDAMCIDIPAELRDEDVAVGLVREYFADDPATGRARYSGAYFERLGGVVTGRRSRIRSRLRTCWR
jgi:hypothetical protein